MLKTVLAKEQCANCRICCSFDKADVWEAPYFTGESMEKIMSLMPEIKDRFEGFGRGSRAKYSFKDDKEILFCPVLDRHKGCRLGDDKPFECRIWPLRAFKLNGAVRVGIAKSCPAFSEKDEDKLKELLDSGLYEKIVSEAENNPEIIKDYSETYRLLK